MNNLIVQELNDLAGKIGRTLKLMEVCGTHTVEIFRHGIRSVIPGSIALLGGPGCPGCGRTRQDNHSDADCQDC